MTGRGSSGPGNARPACPFHTRAAALDLLMLAAGELHDRLCQCVVTFDRPVDAERMARAVALSLRAAPVLDSDFVLGPWGARWEQRPEPSQAFRVVEAPDPEREVQAFLARPLEDGRAPQVAVCLVRGAAGGDRLCLKLHHMVVDGGGLLDYARLLCGTYRGILTDLGGVPAPSPAQDRSLLPVLRRAGPVALAKALLHARYPRTDWGLPARSGDTSGRRVLRRNLDPGRLEGILAFCREQRVSFTDVLATAYHRALAGLLAPPRGAWLPIQMTVDLRTLLPRDQPRPLGMLTGTYYPLLRHDPAAGFGETLEAFQRASAEARRRQAWLGGALALELSRLLPTRLKLRLLRVSMHRQVASGKAHPFFANFGVIDPGTFDLGGASAVDLLLLGPTAFPPNVLLSVCTFRGSLAVTASFPDTAVAPGLMEGLLERFVDELPGSGRAPGRGCRA